MHHALFAVHPDMRLQTEVPLVALPGLMHLRVALAGLVLGGGRRMDNGRIHDRTRRNADAPGLQMHVHSLQHQTAQIVLLQQMAGSSGAGATPRSTPTNRRSAADSYNASSTPGSDRLNHC